MSGLAPAPPGGFFPYSMWRAPMLGALLFFLPAASWAAVLLASVKGQVETRRGAGAWAAVAQVPAVLQNGDSVRTGPGAKCSIEFEDGSKIELGSKADFTLGSSGPAGTSVEQKLGTLKAWVEKAKAREFKVKTPSAVCAVRGTEFLVDVRVDGRTVIELYRGLLGITDNKGNELLLHEGQRLEADPAQMGAPQNLQEHKESKREADREQFRNEVRLDASKDEVLAAAAKELKLAEYQQGKALIDVHGDRVRLEQYILRPQPDQFKLVVLNERQSRFDYFFYLGTFNKTLPTDLSLAMHQLPGCVGAPCDYYLTSYATGRSNLTDKLAELADGGHQVDVNHNGVAEDKVTELFDVGKDAYVDVSGQSVYKTFFDRYGLYVNDTLKFGWSGSNLQTYANNPLTLNADPFTGAALSATLNQPTLVAAPSAAESPNALDPIHQSVTTTYTDGNGAETFVRYDNFIINDEGGVPRWSEFGNATTGNQFHQTLLNWNYEQVITASEFQGRSIDLVVAPKILIQSGLIQ